MKWIWTPKGWLLAILSIGLLGGAALVENDIASNIMIGFGLFFLVISLGRTILNIKRKEEEEEDGAKR
jgi:tellurite resistance protein TehA-like permease